MGIDLSFRTQQAWNLASKQKRKKMLMQAGRLLNSRLVLVYGKLPRDVQEDLQYQQYISEQTNLEQARRLHSTVAMR